MSDYPVRRPNRIPQYDYSSPGSYFLTFCTKDRAPILGQILSGDGAGATVRLTPCGELTEAAVRAIPDVYQNVSLDCFVIMPDHIHLLITVAGSGASLPDVSRIVQQTKRRVSKAVGKAVWQQHYFDHVIRNGQDYREIRQYIENNPQKWLMKASDG